jgi:hypothetical protein
MALLRTNLPPRGLAGLYSRIIRRELGFPSFSSQRPSQDGEETGLFARSLAAALGQAFAAGQTVRVEFALALRDRLQGYGRKRELRQEPSLVEAIDHSVELSEIIAGVGSDALRGEIEISDFALAGAAQADLADLSLRFDWPEERSARSLWSGGLTPVWWMKAPEPPDKWVAPLELLGEPLWTSTHLSGESLIYLLNFGLDRIDLKPQLIQPWTQSVSSLVAAASRPRADIREVVNCCRVDP